MATVDEIQATLNDHLGHYVQNMIAAVVFCDGTKPEHEEKVEKHMSDALEYREQFVKAISDLVDAKFAAQVKRVFDASQPTHAR